MSIDTSNTLKLLYFVKKISEHRFDIRISESCVDPSPLMVERQDPDNFTRFQTRERCALEIAAYVFNKANTSDAEAAFLDLHLSISNDIVRTKIYDKLLEIIALTLV